MFILNIKLEKFPAFTNRPLSLFFVLTEKLNTEQLHILWKEIYEGEHYADRNYASKIESIIIDFIAENFNVKIYSDVTASVELVIPKPHTPPSFYNNITIHVPANIPEEASAL